jgi:hypothetical protein
MFLSHSTDGFQLPRRIPANDTWALATPGMIDGASPYCLPSCALRHRGLVVLPHLLVGQTGVGYRGGGAKRVSISVPA